MKDRFIFLRNFLKNPLRNASVIPSSSFSAKAMFNGIDFSKVKVIVELGPGEGTFTNEIIKRCSGDTKIILIELEKSFNKTLKKKFGNKIIIENDCAGNLNKIIAKYNIENIDLIVSGLPFLPKEPKNKLFEEILRQTNKGAIFRYFTYMPFVMKKIYSGLPIMRKKFVLLNFPPLWVYGIN